MPSPTSSTVPTSSTRRSTSKDSICCRMIELISSVLICMVLSPFVWCDEASPHVRQSPADRPVEDEIAEVDPDAADGLRIEPAESRLDRVQVVRDAAQGLLLKGEIEERLGVDAGRCLVATHSVSATSSTTSRASRR